MEVSHDEKANDGDDDTGKFDFVIRGNAVCNIVGDFLIENGDGGTGSENKNACKEPTNAKIPVHASIIHLIF